MYGINSWYDSGMPKFKMRKELSTGAAAVNYTEKRSFFHKVEATSLSIGGTCGEEEDMSRYKQIFHDLPHLIDRFCSTFKDS